MKANLKSHRSACERVVEVGVIVVLNPAVTLAGTHARQCGWGTAAGVRGRSRERMRKGKGRRGTGNERGAGALAESKAVANGKPACEGEGEGEAKGERTRKSRQGRQKAAYLCS
jgi:hypothetical protein